MNTENVVREFNNIGLASSARSYPGFPSRLEVESHRLPARQACCVRLELDDLLSFAGASENSKLVLLAYDAHGRSALGDLDLNANTDLDRCDFDCGALVGWADSRGLPLEPIVGALVRIDDHTVLRARSRITVWLVFPVRGAPLVEGLSGPEIEVLVSRKSRQHQSLPEPLGELREEFTVRRGTAQSYEVSKGEFVQIIDIEGQQCSDFMAFCASGLDRGEEVMIDGCATRSMTRRAYPTPGLFNKFFDRDMRPLMRVTQDTCGRHDTFGLACTARGYEDRGYTGHINCSDNISDAMAAYGVERRLAWPAINFFWNTWIDPNTQHLLTEESHSRPGDYVVLQAIDRLVCVSTACPDDLDPINGWNPTDVHVRIYRPDAPIRRAVAYRAKEDSPLLVSRESAFHSRTSALTQDFAPTRDLWSPVSFPATGTIGEYWACREKVTLQDMSGLRKYDIIGPDAEQLLQRAMTRDISRLAQWRGVYALMCDDIGAVIDDGTLFRLGPDLFRWCCGSEESARSLNDLALSEGLNVRLNDMSNGLVNLALQGPKARALLETLVFTQPTVPSLSHMKWFGVTIGRLQDRDGTPFMLSRTGYTGELGFELFFSSVDAEQIWDALIEAGEEFGIAPMGNAALDMIRIEAGLAANGAEFVPGCDAFEAGLGFAVDFRKTDFVGKTALERNSQSQRRQLKGLVFECHDLPARGSPVLLGDRQVGEVTSSTRSPMLEGGIAMARLAVEHGETGKSLDVGMMDGRLKRLVGNVVDIPFIDPKRERPRA